MISRGHAMRVVPNVWSLQRSRDVVQLFHHANPFGTVRLTRFTLCLLGACV